MASRKRGFADIQSEQAAFEPENYSQGIPDMTYGDLLSQNSMPHVPFAQNQMVPYIQQGGYAMPQNGFAHGFLDGTAQPADVQDDFGQDDGYPEDLEKRIVEAKARKKNKLPPFVEKVSTFVNDENNYEIIRWADDGDSFVVLDEDRFSKELIPGVFKHNNFASFVRQLNMYNFHKKVGMTDGSLKASMDGQKARLEYEHKYFKRGHPDMLFLIEKPKAGRKTKSSSGKKLENLKEESDDDLISDDDHYENERPGAAPRLIEDAPSGQNGQDFYNNNPSSNAPQPGPSHVSNIKPGGIAYSNIITIVDSIVTQINELKSQQALISMNISRLRQEHQQLSKQASVFQEMHERHEMSISNILQFLASVYNKNIDGTPQNGLVAQPHGIVGMQNFGKHNAAEIVANRPTKRARYLIEDGRNTAAGNRKIKTNFNNGTEQNVYQDTGRLQELDTPTDNDGVTVRQASTAPATPTIPNAGGASKPNYNNSALIKNSPGSLSVNNTPGTIALNTPPMPQPPSDTEIRKLEEHQAAVDMSLKELQQNVENLAGGDFPSFDMGNTDGINFADGDLSNWFAGLSPGSLQAVNDNLKDLETTMDPVLFDPNELGNGVENTHISSNHGSPEARVEELRHAGQTP